MDFRRGSTTKHSGISRKSIVHIRSRGFRESTIISAAKKAERMREVEGRRRAVIQDMSEEECQAFAQMDIETFGSADDIEAVNHLAPLDEVGFDISHAGGEYEVFDDLAKDIAMATGYYKQVDHRTRRDRTENQTQQWEMQIERLVTAYLSFRSTAGLEAIPQAGQAPDESDPSTPAVETVDLFARRKIRFDSLTTETDLYPNETLLRNGYLGCSPVYPTVAISLRTLFAYRQMHRTCPQFSFEAVTKTLCHMHNVCCQKVPYHGYLRNQLSAAFDVYLLICQHVNRQINSSLGFNSENRLARLCPPCFFRVPGEAEQEFSVLVSMDGNNSLKRVKSSVRGQEERPDSREVISDRWLSAAEVNKFKDETQDTVFENLVDADDAPTESNESTEAESPESTDVTGSTNAGFNCADRWKNAGSDTRKRMFDLFDETGIFIASCRHRMVLYVCDMIQSGELAKYPIAITDRLMANIGNRIGCAYDIGCVFSKTVAKSPIGLTAKEKQLRMMVGAFHGHAHNRACQLAWHPMYIKGTGLTDGEGCEHVFSSSNELARSTRHCSRFHRHQAIEDHFQFWDQDKYALLSKFILNHYREATNLIHTLEQELAIIKEQLRLTDSDFEQFFEEERKYLDNLKQMPKTDEMKIKYIHALNEMARWKLQWAAAKEEAENIFNRVAHEKIYFAITQTKERLDTAFSKFQDAQTQVMNLEKMLNIRNRWTSDSDEYQKFRKLAETMDYQKALDELERLAVMRMFELPKLRAANTGNKLRVHLGKALKRRLETLRNALNRYNAQAKKLDRPELSWNQLTEYTLLGEFDLLRLARQDIRDKLWSKPAYRDACVKYFRLCRAREEITRLNVEVRRLEVSIQRETAHVEKVLHELSQTNKLLANEISHRWRLRSSVNMIHLERFDRLKSLAFFTADFPTSDEHDDELENEENFYRVTEFIDRIAD